MSIPYYVLKKHAVDYDKQLEEKKPILLLYDKDFSSIDVELKHLLNKDLHKYYTTYEQRRLELDTKYKSLFDAIDEKYKHINLKSAFNVINEGDYYTYFRGARLDETFGTAMMEVAQNGIDKITKALKGK